MPESGARHDVAILTDFRYPGGTSASVAEEIRAQAGAGLSTVLVQVPSPHLRAARSFNGRIVDCLVNGLAELANPRDVVSARVLVIRQPRIFTEDPLRLPRIEADEVVMVVNQAPRDLASGRVYYDLADVRARVERLFGDRVRWATIGPLVREQVLGVSNDFPLEPGDWHNVVNVAEWWTPRPRPVDVVPVIGRHSRPDPMKWPATAEEILAAYPATPDVKVRILGGADQAIARIGYQPKSWDVLPFNAMSPVEFLRTIDFFVYFHHPGLVEAFGRTVIEAMASGAVAILPFSFKALFEDAALYASPREVTDLVRGLYADWDQYQARSAAAASFVEQRFGYASHIERLRALGVPHPAAATEADTGQPDRSPSPHRIAVAEPDRTVARDATVDGGAASGAARGRLMMLSSNGAGLGHVTRLMAIARRLRGTVDTLIATQSYAASVVEGEGFLTEYIPSRLQMDVPAAFWNDFLEGRLRHLVETYAPQVVAVDGTVPYEGLLRTMTAYPTITWVWVRRAMWKPGLGDKWLERGQAYDVVLEPGEFAAAVDQGLTVAERSHVRRVAPITYLDHDEILGRDEARAALNLGDGPAALVQLGAGNINDIATPTARVTRHLLAHGFQVVLAESPIATKSVAVPEGVMVVKRYPLSRYLQAFDLAVSASGYNSYHELIAHRVPSVFIPNEDTALDDQVARARYAAEVGVALMVDEQAGLNIETVLDQAVQPEVRERLATRCAELAYPNGAVEAATWLAGIVASTGGDRG